MIPIIVQTTNVSESLHERSKRLIKGEPQIVYLIKRLLSDYDGKIVLAITNDVRDNELESIADSMGVEVFRGEFEDVLSRLIGAANYLGTDNFVRVYGNYPLVDIEQLKELVKEHIEGGYEYSYNEHRDGVLWGTGCDVFKVSVLENMELEDCYQREMVSFYLQQNSSMYKVFKMNVLEKRPSYKLNFETEKDLKVITEVINNVESITNESIVQYLNAHEVVALYNIEAPAKEVGIEKLYLHGEKVQDILQKGVYADSYPISVELTLTNRCNLKCVYCSDLDLRARQGNDAYLSYDVLSRLFEDLSNGGTKGVVFEGGGEPTLHPEFESLVMCAYDNNLGIGLITNGTVRLREEILSKFEWIRVSLDASNAKEYYDLKKVDCFERVMSNIAFYAEHCDMVGVGYVVTNNNMSNIETLVMRLREMGVSYVQLRPVVDMPELLPKKENLKYLEFYRGTRFNVIVDGMKENMEGGNNAVPCVANSITSVISGDGSVYLCGRLNIYDWIAPIGNIKQQTYSEIWKGAERKRQLDMVGNAEFCSKNCPQCRVSKFNQLFDRLSKTKSIHFI